MGLVLALPASAAATRTVEGDVVVLENQLIRARINAAKGGRLESLVFLATRAELVSGESIIEEVCPMGGARLSLGDEPMTLLAETGGEKGAVCALERMLPNGEAPGRASNREGVRHYQDPVFDKVRLRKTCLLPAGEARLFVRYRLTNTGPEPATVCLALKDRLGDLKTAGDVAVAGGAGCMVFPEKMGRDDFHRTIYFDRRRPHYAFTNLSGGYVAAVSKAGAGAVRHVDPRYLTHLRLHVDGKREKEALSTDVTIGAGETWDLETVVLPFAGVTDLCGASADLVAGIFLERTAGAVETMANDADLAGSMARDKGAAPASGPGGGKVFPARHKIAARLMLMSAVSRRAGIELSLRHGYRGRPRSLGTLTADLAAGRPKIIPFHITLSTEGTWYVALDLKENGRTVTRIERPVVAGYPSGMAAAPPVAERLGAPHREDLRDFPPEITWRPEPDVASPHVAIARPYARGAVKVMFLYPYYAARDLVEIAQRLDLDYDFAAIGCAPASRGRKLGQGAPAPREVERARRLLVSGKHDVYVAAFNWQYWPWDIRKEILWRVANEGAGLVLLNPGDLDDDLVKIRKSARPAKREFPGVGVVAVRHRKGRILFLGKPSRVDQPQVRRDFSGMESFIRALLWAAQKEPKLIVRAHLPAGRITAGAPGKIRLELRNSGVQPTEGTLRLVFRQALDRMYGLIYNADDNQVPLRRWEDRGAVERKISVRGGSIGNEEFDMPAVPAGQYHVHASLVDGDGKVVSWMTKEMRVESPVSVGEVWLAKKAREEVRADYKTSPFPRIGFFPAETLRARVVLAGAEGINDIACRLRLTDPHDRLIFDRTKPGAEVRFEAPLGHALHHGLIAVFEAASGGRTLAETRIFVPVRRRAGRRNGFRFTELDNEGLVPYEALEFAQYANGSGINRRFIQCAMRNFEFHANGMDILPGRVKWQKTTRVPCLNDPAWRAKTIEKYRKLLPFYDMFGKVELPITHEASGPYHTRGLNPCHCEHCQRAFRKYLQRIYPNLAALNLAWGSNHGDWTQITIPELDLKRCPPPAKWAPAIDTIWWINDQQSDWGDEIARLMKELTTDGIVGNWALNKMSIHSGMDFWRMSQWGAYGIMYRDYNEWQSMCGKNAIRMWRGYGRDYNPSQQAREPWDILLRDEPGSGDFTCNWYPMCMPDGRLFEAPEAYFSNYRDVRHGPARLLLGRGTKDGVAIHWSSPSFYAYQMERWNYLSAHGKSALAKGGGQMDWPRRIAHLCQGTGGLGLRVFYISHGQLEKGGFGFWERPRIIFLPYSTVMSPAEAKTLEEFVRDGGVLVGGVNPATRDRHAIPHRRPLLDHVFGVERGSYAGPVISQSADDANVKVTFDIGIPERPEFHALVVAPPNVTAKSARPLAHYSVGGKRCPAFLVNNFGKGKAILLNFEPLHLNEYTGEKMTAEAGEAYRQVIRHCIGLSGARRWAEVSTNGEPGGAGYGHFRDGDNHYVGLTTQWGMPPSYHRARKTTLTLPETRHVYELIRGEYVGHTDRIEVPFGVDRLANIYSCLPYNVTGVELSPAKARWRPGEIVTFDVAVKAEGGAPGRHVFRVEVSNPSGETVRLYSYNLEAPNGRAAGKIFLALNDPPGEWTINVRDVATGLVSAARFAVGAQ